MPPPLSVEPLARHRGLVPMVATWFGSEWPEWYGKGGPGNVTDDLRAFARAEDVLPVGLVAFENGTPVGAGALKAQSIPSHVHLTPWAAAGFVVPERRGRGIGAALLRALVAKARELGYPAIYCGTSTAGSLLLRSGWSPIEVTSVSDKPLTIFCSAT